MLRTKRTVALTAIAVTVALGATACGGSGNSAAGSGTRIKGGTLNYFAPSDFDSLDPQRTYTTQGQNIGREMERSLTGYKFVDGKPVLTGDLATDTGTASNGAKTWTFHLRSGVKWQDGTPVTAQDVKYGIERSFSPDISGGAPYATMFLSDSKHPYTGPFTGKSLSTIDTPDASTIVFHLNQPVADFNAATTMEEFAAVPKAHDTGATYNAHVWSDGPYMVESYQKDKELLLKRNPYWTQASDPLRQQNVDKIDVQMSQTMKVIDQQMKSDAGEAQTAIIDDPMDGTDLTPFTTDPQLKSRIHSIPAPGINYLAINVDTVKDIRVREAIEYAINKQTVRGAFGGSAYGDYATTMINPGSPGYKKFALFGTDPQGDVAKAKALLKQAGAKNVTLSLADRTTTTDTQVATAIKSALARVGITVNIQEIPRASYFPTIENVKNSYDLTWADWFADYPSPSTVLPILFNGAQIKTAPQSNQDYARLNDPAINKQIATIAKMTDAAKADAAYGELDEAVNKQAAVVPLVYMKQTEMQGSKVGGLIDDPVLAEMSLENVYLTK